MIAPARTAGTSHRACTSLRRRTAFADRLRFSLDETQALIGRRRRMRDLQWAYYTGTLGYDLIEGLVPGSRWARPGRPHLAAIEAGVLLAQDPRYRAYWYDPQRHSLVGALLGLDLHPLDGGYCILESNLTCGLMPDRRALYRDEFDPLITRLIGFAKAHDFRRILLHRRSWRSAHQQEFAHAAARFGIEIRPASSMHEDGDPPVNPMSGLPFELDPETIYVACTAISESAVFQFLHHKAVVDRWLAAQCREAGADAVAIRAVRSSATPWVPPLPSQESFPNLVVKLSSADEGQAVAMGRFTSLDALKSELRITDGGSGVPALFRTPLHRRALAALLPGLFSTTYQSFVPPEVIDGYPAMMRAEVFISPLGDVYLSAHRTIGGVRLPDRLPPNRLSVGSAFNVSVPPGVFHRLSEHEDRDLAAAMLDFGRLARRAITSRFVTTPCQG